MDRRKIGKKRTYQEKQLQKKKKLEKIWKKETQLKKHILKKISEGKNSGKNVKKKETKNAHTTLIEKQKNQRTF